MAEKTDFISFKLNLWVKLMFFFSKLGVSVQLLSGVNMCLVYWAGLVNMGSMLTGNVKVSKEPVKDDYLS